MRFGFTAAAVTLMASCQETTSFTTPLTTRSSFPRSKDRPRSVNLSPWRANVPPCPLQIRDDTDTDGLKNAPVIFASILLLAVWLFSVPSDFRRARFCSEQQIIDNPGSRCTTLADWSNGIAQYYKEGGGVNFDFSVEKEGNVWVGGDKIEYGVK